MLLMECWRCCGDAGLLYAVSLPAVYGGWYCSGRCLVYVLWRRSLLLFCVMPGSAYSSSCADAIWEEDMPCVPWRRCMYIHYPQHYYMGYITAWIMLFLIQHYCFVCTPVCSCHFCTVMCGYGCIWSCGL